MKDENLVKIQSEEFAVRIINLYKHLSYGKGEYVLSKQLLRSGTSIGANVNEALCAISKKDFLSKMYIAFKECNETKYWLRLLHRTDYLTESEMTSIYSDCESLFKILSSITKTTSETLNS